MIVDNKFGAGRYLINPIAQNANIVVHSATEWVGGQGTTIGGVVIDSGKFYSEGNVAKSPHLVEPAEAYHIIQYNIVFGNAISFICIKLLRAIDAFINLMAASQLIQGIETISLRVDRHVENGLKHAKWLEPGLYVNWVLCPGLEFPPSHGNAKKYLKHGFGAVLSVCDKKQKDKSSAEVAIQLKLFI